MCLDTLVGTSDILQEAISEVIEEAIRIEPEDQLARSRKATYRLEGVTTCKLKARRMIGDLLSVLSSLCRVPHRLIDTGLGSVDRILIEVYGTA